MPVHKDLHRIPTVRRGLSMLVLIPLLMPRMSAATQPAPVFDSGYASALATADHFLQAWQASDAENGMALLSSHAKEAVNRNAVERFFSNSESSAYEIDRGKLLKRGRYEFPVVLVTVPSKNIHARRRFSAIVIVNTGNNDWAVDKLP
jgi:hypothetical protein